MRALWLAVFAISTQVSRPVPSVHVRGPNGLEGWTLNWPVEGYEDRGPQPMTLMIARHGHRIRKIEGASFIGMWMFTADGRSVAYETGPFHFGLTCVLLDIRSGKEMATYDCYRNDEENGPGWVRTLAAYARTHPPKS